MGTHARVSGRDITATWRVTVPTILFVFGGSKLPIVCQKPRLGGESLPLGLRQPPPASLKFSSQAQCKYIFYQKRERKGRSWRSESLTPVISRGLCVRKAQL